MARPARRARLRALIQKIKASGLSIYDSLEDLPELYLDTEALEAVLGDALIGLDLDFPLRTRSKVLKSKVCEILGYPVPTSFKRSAPRFPGQNFDTYVQKADNLQIWNQQVAPSRRYVRIRVNEESEVSAVRVVTGTVLAELDRTGTLTHKYQARSRVPVSASTLVSISDTANVVRHVTLSSKEPRHPANQSSLRTRLDPQEVMTIAALYKNLRPLAGSVIPDPGVVQERIRGAGLHKLVSRTLAMGQFADTGQFPDIPEQLLELKLQTAATIDLGLISPDSSDQLADLPEFRHCDVRYAVFYGQRVHSGVRLDALVLTTGADFFSFFRRFEGQVRNTKIQIPLPRDFFREPK